ncbi:MAG: hypothetical protein ACRDOH_26355 [Streptosporangiaceae bacterium]
MFSWRLPRSRASLALAAADRWTWIVIAYAQLWLARTLAADLRRPEAAR